VVGAPSDGTRDLLALCNGSARPSRGTVRIDGLDPYRSPSLRRSLGTVIGDEQFEEKTVMQAVVTRLALHGSNAQARETFRRFDLEHVLDRRTSSLAADERRLVALLIALSIDKPRALLLHEPAVSGSRMNADRLLEELGARAKHSIILCTTASPRLAALLSPEALLLEDGRLKRATQAPTRPAFAPGSPPRVRIECEHAARLAQALSTSSAVSGLEFSGRDAQLIVEGTEVEALCLAVLRSSVELGVVISGLTQVLPEAIEIRATHAALARTAYERTYGAFSSRAVSAPTVGENPR
jgi:energy-coupling factor transporter ATP-binding protein EcfA2